MYPRQIDIPEDSSSHFIMLPLIVLDLLDYVLTSSLPIT